MACSPLVTLIFVFLSYFSKTHGVSVSKQGTGDYQTIGAAIAAAPNYTTQPYIISVKAGIYDEYLDIPEEKTNLVLIGEGKQQTKVVGSHSQNSGWLMNQTSTIAIHGSGFMAQKIAFVNSAGVDAGPAVAVRSESNNSVFYECSFEGFQDTLWAVSGSQFYRDCTIYGTVDFIFGGASAVFQNCMIYARFKDHVTFTAQSREEAEKLTSFTFQKCNFTMSPEDASRKKEVKATLGRPWSAYSTVAILESYIDSMVVPTGWEGMIGQPIDKLTYVEYNNCGPGSFTEKRVAWAGVQVLTDQKEALPFTASILLDGDNWIPKKGIPYDEGLSTEELCPQGEIDAPTPSTLH